MKHFFHEMLTYCTICCIDEKSGAYVCICFALLIHYMWNGHHKQMFLVFLFTTFNKCISHILT
jgi:hypothetical protein